MNKIFLLLSFITILSNPHLIAQDTSAIVDFESTTKGILIPRMLESERNAIITPANGLLVYQTDGNAGFYFNYGDGISPDWKLAGLPAGGTNNQVLSTDVVGNVGWRTLDDNRIIDSDEDTWVNAIDQGPPSSDRIEFVINGNSTLSMAKNYKSFKMHTGPISQLDNIYLGYRTGFADDSSSRNVGIGNYALENFQIDGVATNVANTAIGDNTLRNLGTISELISARNNTAIGANAGEKLENGYDNTLLGTSAGPNILFGIGNAFIGSHAGLGLNGSCNNNTVIGANSSPSPMPVYSQSGAVKIGFNAGRNDSTDNVLHIANRFDESLIYGEFNNKIISLNGDIGIRTQNPTADLHILGDSSSTHAEILIAPATNSGDTSSLTLAENGDGSLGMMMRFDGADNKLRFIGRLQNDLSGPHLVIQRNNPTRVGIGDTHTLHEFNVEGDTRITGYTKLGSDSPSIKMKKLTGTSATAEGGSTNIPHGLSRAQILSVNVLLDEGTFTVAPHDIAEYNFLFYITDTGINVQNVADDSGNILSKPISVLITYEE